MNNAETKKCPLCEGDNLCAIAAGEPPESCWCQSASITPEALSAIPDEARGVRCVCPNCAKKIKEPKVER